MRTYKRKKICIICEGYEELDYIEALKNKAVFSEKYEFITVNVKSINTIINQYDHRYKTYLYSLVLVFCDTDKSPYSKYIKQFVGIDNYKATEEQRKELFAKIKRSNYETMKKNIVKISTNDNDISSTNILKFIEKFESDDDSWIDEINSKL